MLALTVWASAFSANALACTGIYAGGGTTENGSVYLGRSEDFGPDWVKQFVIVPAADDERMVALAKSASDEEVTARANQLANENAEYIKRIASEKLTEIDNAVSAYIEESGLEQAANHHPGEAVLPIVLLCVLLVLVCSFIGYRVMKRKKAKRV